jgi:hypothetical protein
MNDVVVASAKRKKDPSLRAVQWRQDVKEAENERHDAHAAPPASEVWHARKLQPESDRLDDSFRTKSAAPDGRDRQSRNVQSRKVVVSRTTCRTW